MTNNQWHEKRSQVIANGMGAAYPLYVAKAKNAYVWDVEGNQYIDFAAGIAVTNTGHSNERIMQAVKDQLDRSQVAISKWLQKIEKTVCTLQRSSCIKTQSAATTTV